MLADNRRDLLDLLREFAGRGDDERERLAVAQAEALHERERERGRLAGAGLGGSNDVAPGQDQRNRLTLDGSRFGVAHLLDGSEEVVVQALSL